MKILFFGSYFYPYISGITTYPLVVLTYLAKKNKVTALTFNHQKNIFSKEILNGICVKRMPYLFRLSKGFISIQSIKFFYQEVKKNDVVVVNYPNAEGLLLSVFAKIFRKKIIGIFHCRVFLSGNIYFSILNILLNLVVWMQMLFADKIVIYTRDYFQSLSVEKLFSQKIVQTFPPIKKNSIDDDFYRELIEQKGDEIWIGFSGRVAKEKGLEYLLEAISKVQKNSSKKISLVLVGPSGRKVVGENDYFTKIIGLLNEKKVRHKFFGTLEGKQLWSFYNAIDILALTSINQTEAFGMVQVEAMMCRKPVMASNLPGVRVPVLETKMGIITEPKNVDSIVNGIHEILNNYDKYSNKQTHQDCLSIFDIKKTFSFYDKLIKSGEK